MAAASPALAASTPLVDLSAAGTEQRVVAKNNQVTVARSDDAGTPGVIVTVQPGADAYPGVTIKPESPTWDLSAFGHVEAKVTNLGDAPLALVLQIDNAGDWHNAPWNAEQVTIKPGASGTVSVIFGFTYGHKPGYPLKSAEISRALVFVKKSDAVQSFRIDSIIAAGEAGEKPAVDPNSVRIRPKDGVVVGNGVAFDAAKQVDAVGGAQVSLVESAVRVELTGKSGESIAFKPPMGKWNLGNYSQIRVKVKNVGATPVKPAFSLVSEKVNSTDSIALPAPLNPGASADLVVPFAAAAAWKGMPSSTIFKGALSGEKTGSPDVQPGTGTRFASDRTDAIKMTAVHSGQASLLIESITAETPAIDRPDWLGTRPPVEGEWTKTFDDDFTSTQIDLTKWNNFGPNYWDKISHWSKQNVVLDGQVAKLHYEKKTGYQNDDPTQKQSDYTGGYIDTFGKFRQRYGYFEARLKLPTAPGLWPAFWMMPDRGPDTPDAPGSKKNRCTTSNGAMEFDIMEQLTIWGTQRYNIAMHWDDYGANHKSIGTGKIYFQPDKDGFVTTGLLWTPGLAVYYCNGKEIARWEDPRISNVPSYMILYMPTGGWDNNALDGTGLPDDLTIDYVRVWQRADLTQSEGAAK